MVFVNTVVIVREVLGGGERDVAWALAMFGGGSMAVALCLPKLLERITDRQVMLSAALTMVAVLLTLTGLWWSTGGPDWAMLAVAWIALGMAYAGLVTPGGRLLRRSARADDLPFLFATQFSLSHLCWLIAYPLAGWLGARLGFGVALPALCVLAAIGGLVAWFTWPGRDPDEIAHHHSDLPTKHPHWSKHALGNDKQMHKHSFVIDDLHQCWPR